MALDTIEKLLQNVMGLHHSTVGSSTVSQAVEQRMRDCGIDNIDAYTHVLNQSKTELDALIDAVIIPETWFFRDRNPFTAFSDWVHTEWMTRNTATPLHILSLPCSTGEEPYTLAMCLADCGVPPALVQIDAIDISNSSLEKARTAHYGRNSFRGANLEYRDRYFDSCGDGFRLTEDIRKQVRFERANILDDDFTSERPPYHVIFCRNLLIYFDRPTQHRAIDQLEQLLTLDGLMFLGHSETSLLANRDFTSLDVPRCFGYRRGQHQTIDDKTGPAAQKRKLPNRPRPARPAPEGVLPFANVVPAPGQAVRQVTEEPAPEMLQEAFQLADQGHLDEAADRCEQLLHNKDNQADAYYLLGLIREAVGNTVEAEEMFRKAVYLAPNHYEALTHLAVICKRKGDSVGAQRFSERAGRAQQRG